MSRNRLAFRSTWETLRVDRENHFVDPFVCPVGDDDPIGWCFCSPCEVGGGINTENAAEYLEAGLGHLKCCYTPGSTNMENWKSKDSKGSPRKSRDVKGKCPETPKKNWLTQGFFCKVNNQKLSWHWNEILRVVVNRDPGNVGWLQWLFSKWVVCHPLCKTTNKGELVTAQAISAKCGAPNQRLTKPNVWGSSLCVLCLNHLALIFFWFGAL